jgi:asparaginyl-tRNA synthetase
MLTVKEILKGGRVGEDVEIRGWIFRTRTVGGKIFVVVRDGTGVIQTAITKGGVPENEFADAEKALIESSVVVRGKVTEDKRAPGGYELRVADFKVEQFAEKFPIQQDLSEEFLLDVRHLWIRSQRMAAIFRVRHTVFGAVHEYFRERGYFEAHPPMITPAGSEGGSTLFELEYFGRKAYLTQSWQLYAEALMESLGKVYYVGPSFRAEKSRTTRHLTEYWHCEMEEAWAGMEDVIKHAEGVISQACQRVTRENVDDLRSLGVDPADIAQVKAPFKHIRYNEALKILEKAGMSLEWGQDLRTLEERELTKDTKVPIVVTHYPKVSQAFYKANDKDDPKVVLAFDIIAPTVGELVGGSEREQDIKILEQNLKNQGEDLGRYQWYLDTRRYGSVPHSGFGMGMERLIQFICRLEHIRDAIPFPRTPARFAP